MPGIPGTVYLTRSVAVSTGPMVVARCAGRSVAASTIPKRPTESVVACRRRVNSRTAGEEVPEWGMGGNQSKRVTMMSNEKLSAAEALALPVAEEEPPQREAIAAHEAGHAVIGLALGGRWPRLLRVHIQQSKTRYGHCICEKWPQRSTTYRTWARRVGATILVSLAGPIAEARAGGRPHVWDHTDTREVVVDVASVIGANGVLFANGGEPIPLEVVKAGTDHVRRSLPQAEELVDKF